MAAVDLTKLFSRTFELKNGSEITFDQSAVGDVGCVVWDAALVLCSYIDRIQNQLQDKFILELGAGTGAVGLVASALGAKVVITDLPEIVPFMQHNISMNQSIVKDKCTALELTWGNNKQMLDVKGTHFPEDVDFLFLADCVYYEESLDDLVNTVLFFTSPKTTVLCSYEDRELGNKTELQSRFFKRLGEHLNITEVALELQDPHYSSPDIHIMHMALKENKIK